MRFSSFVPAVAGLVGLAQATLPVVGEIVKGKADVLPPTFDLTHDWEDHVLFKGVAAPQTAVSAAVQLDLHLAEAQVSGNIGVNVLETFLEKPSLRLSLAGVQAYIKLDLSASAAVRESIELFASPEVSIDVLDILDIDLKALICLDLIVAASASIDVSAGFQVSFDEGAFIDIDLIKRDVLEVYLAEPIVKALPLAIGADVDLTAAIDLEIGLRLRTLVGIEAGVDILGLDLVDAGAEVAIFVSLFDYKTTIIAGTDCIVYVKEAFALALGIAVELNVEILDLIELNIVPTALITLATLEAELCLGSRGDLPPYLGGNAEDNGNGSGQADDDEGDDEGDDSGDAGSDAGAVTTSAAHLPTITPGPHSNSSMTTSVISSTAYYTITSCAVEVENCPASYTQKVVTSTIISKTTVCPVGGEPTKTRPAKPVITITDTSTHLVPCKTRTTSTFTPPVDMPTPVPTITVVDTTTVCPTGEATPSGPKPGPSTTTIEVPPTGGAPQPPPEVPTYVVPPPPSNSTLSSVVTPPPTGGYAVPPPSETPTAPPTAGAGSLKIGMTSIFLGAAIAVML